MQMHTQTRKKLHHNGWVKLHCVPEAEANKIIQVHTDSELIQNGLVQVENMFPRKAI